MQLVVQISRTRGAMIFVGGVEERRWDVFIWVDVKGIFLRISLSAVLASCEAVIASSLNSRRR